MRLNAVADACADFDYPLTHEELLAAVGDEHLELQNGDQRLAEALSPMGHETYESPAEVQEAAVTGVGPAAIGRRFYSDRDAPMTSEFGPDQVSF